MDQENYYKKKIIVITGAAGSIGRQLVKQIIKYDIESVRILDNNETGLFDLEHELNSNKIRPLIGDIRDKDRLLFAFEGADIVFHAAALKHVPLCEFNPFDAVKTNVIGTQNVIEAALAKNVEKVINISTDKASNPTNVMGATKLVAERLIISASYYQGTKKTKFSNIRFGNVLNSRGSVLPLFEQQIKNKGPVTVTDKEMTRFIMSIPNAVDLIIKAGVLAQGREIFILKMPSIRIIDLAETMIETLSKKFNLQQSEISIKYIGKRGGEKIHEELMTFDEIQNAIENDTLYILLPHKYYETDISYEIPAGFKKLELREVSSNQGPSLSKAAIKKILESIE